MVILHEIVLLDQGVDNHKGMKIKEEVVVAEVVVDIEDIKELGGPRLLEEGWCRSPISSIDSERK